MPTYGNTAPGTATYNFDYLFTHTLANTKDDLIDQVGSSQAFLYEVMKKKKFYDAVVGGTHLEDTIMYEFGEADTFDTWETLPITPVDGVTKSQHQIRKLVAAIMYAMEDVRKNKGKAQIRDLVKTKMDQGRMAIEESWSKHFFSGNGAGAIDTPRVSGNNTRSIDPLAKIIPLDPATGTYGEIDRATNSWWRSRSYNGTAATVSGVTSMLGSAIDTGSKLLEAMESIMVDTATGTGGGTDLILMGPDMYKKYIMSWFKVYQQNLSQEPDYPFESRKFMNARVVLEEKIGDVRNNQPYNSASATTNSMYFLNTKFFRVKYDPGMNFDMILDENGKAFTKPTAQDGRLGHIAWRGQVTCNNPRKQAVLWGIPKTFTFV